MGEEVAIRQAGQVSAIPDAREITSLYKLGEALARGGLFPDARQTFQAMTKLVLGRDLGLSATAAMTGIYIVEGRPELGSNLQAQMIRTWLGLGGERYDYEVEGPTETACAVTVYRVNPGVTYGDKENYQRLGRAEFTIEDAQRANLIKPKSAWATYPKNMLFARAISNAIAFFCPEVTGGVRLYAPGEAGNADPGARAVDVGDLAARTAAVQEQERVENVTDAEVIEDAADVLTPEQQAEIDRLDREYGETMPDVDEVAQATVAGQQESFAGEPQPEPETPQVQEESEDPDYLSRLVHQGLIEIGEGDKVIEARLRGAGQNVTALKNLLKFIDNKKQQMEGGS